MLHLNLLPTRMCRKQLHKISTGFKQCPPCNDIAKTRYRGTPKGKAQRERRSQSAQAYRVWNEHHLQWSYGISLEDFARMLHRQEFKCAGCRAHLKIGRFTSPKERASAAHVDHCHTSGAVRGILCMGCNSAIGNAVDDPDTLRRLADYLEASRGR